MRVMSILAATLCAGLARADDVEGRWLTEPGESGGRLVVEIAPCAGAPEALCGDAVAAVSPEGRRVTDHPFVGRAIVRGMRPDGSDRWTGGRVSAPDDGRDYRGSLTLRDSRLEVEGCVLVFCRGQVWQRDR